MKEKEKIISLKGLILCIVLFLAFYYSSYFQLIPILLFNMDIKNLTGNQTVMLSAFSNIILLIILLLVFRKSIVKEWKTFKNDFLENLDTGVKYWLVGLMISSLPWLMLINAGLIAPCIEELIFRKSFKKTFPNKWLFIIISSLVFGSLHVLPSMTSPVELLYVIPYGALGASFACMYQKTDTIFTSIAMHIFHNSALILLSILV